MTTRLTVTLLLILAIVCAAITFWMQPSKSPENKKTELGTEVAPRTASGSPVSVAKMETGGLERNSYTLLSGSFLAVRSRLTSCEAALKAEFAEFPQDERAATAPSASAY